MKDEKKIIKGLDKELMQLIDAEMNDPVLGKLLNRNVAYVLGKEIKLLLINKACDWLDYHLTFNVVEWDEGVTTQRVIDKFRKAMKGE